MTIEQRITSLERKLDNVIVAVSNLATRQSDRANASDEAISETESKLDTVNDSVSGKWNNLQTYAIGEYVLCGNELYKCRIQNYGIAPSNETYWIHTNIANELNEIVKEIKA